MRCKLLHIFVAFYYIHVYIIFPFSSLTMGPVLELEISGVKHYVGENAFNRRSKSRIPGVLSPSRNAFSVIQRNRHYFSLQKKIVKAKTGLI